MNGHVLFIRAHCIGYLDELAYQNQRDRKS